MNFREWLINETPQIYLSNPDGSQSVTQNLSVVAGDPGKPTQLQTIQANRIDMRYEDYGLFKTKPSPLKKHFAIPLADGKYINVVLDSGLGGPGVIDTEKHNYADKDTKQFVPYDEIRPDWASFAQFVNQNTVTKHAPGDAYRGGNSAAIS